MPLLDLNEFEEVNKDFKADYVIVGGGTSGLVIANRLSEDPNVNVVCLEAGTDMGDDPRLNIPMLGTAMYENDDYDWGFLTSPQEQLKGRQLCITRGRTLGGTSAIHYGLMKPPSKVGMDGWEALGNPGWNWDTFEPYLYKGTTMHPPKGELCKHVRFPTEKKGDGPLHISYFEDLQEFHDAWFETFERLGHPQRDDPIKGGGLGPYPVPTAVDPINRVRSYAGSAYYDEDTETRTNLYVVVDALVEKIHLDKRGENDVVATGVRASNKGTAYTISAAKEVILAAGAIKTPQLLELSGIGSSKILSAQAIEPIIVNESVGENLQSHAFVALGYELRDDCKTVDSVMDYEVAEQIMKQYMEDRSGPMGQLFLVYAIMALKDPFMGEEKQHVIDRVMSQCENTPQKRQCEIMIEKLGDPREPTADITMKPFQIRPRAGPLRSQMWDCKLPGNFISVGTTLLHPVSRGSSHISSSDPQDQPVIDSKMLSHPLDLDYLTRHLMFTDSIFDEEPMASIVKQGGIRLHCEERIKDMSFERVQDLCKELAVFSNDVCGTCAMLPREEWGVVDPNLKVYGTSNLRVVGEAMFPLLPRGDSTRTAFAVAEQAADIIRGRS
ncbi:hypothetical protein KEM56_000665 [Ascosphaera pollenicola]|nr:hypothetical protein KEM56_000665 [Ascosphaera pollenicola]